MHELLVSGACAGKAGVEPLQREIRSYSHSPLGDLCQEIDQTGFVFCRSEKSGFFVARDIELQESFWRGRGRVDLPTQVGRNDRIGRALDDQQGRVDFRNLALCIELRTRQ